MLVPKKVRDISGGRYGRLTVQSFSGISDTGKALWLCVCDCGTNKTATSRHLITGDCVSCGCIAVERRIAQLKKVIDGDVVGLSGIYRIRSLVDDREYVGSAVNILERWRIHEFDLHHGKHANNHLQKFHDKYGGDMLEFSIIDICEASDLIGREQHFIDTIKPAFNICMVANSTFGRKHTEGAIAKMRANRKGKGIGANLGRKHTAETRAKMSAGRKGKYVGYRRAPFTEEHRKAISQAAIRSAAAGRRRNHSKLSDEQICAIRAEAESGIERRTIMQTYGISRGHLSKITNRTAWKHVKKTSERFDSPL